MADSDFQMAMLLQKQFEMEANINTPPVGLSYESDKKKSRKKKQNLNSSKCLTDPSWEVIDPTPDIHVLFIQFDQRYFWKRLQAVTVSWSKRMTSCAGICSYQGRAGLCKITLSEPLLKLRPRKDLIETLLHEMIHAFLFVTHNNRDRDGHGPEFHKHMYRINNEAGTNISVYHDFHDEVRLYKQHWWRCEGPCQKLPPFFGMVRRAMNRAPGPNDRWWAEHERNCGGKFKKVKEPEKKKRDDNGKEKNNKQDNNGKKLKDNKGNGSDDLRKYIPVINKTGTGNMNGNIKTLFGNNGGNTQGAINKNGTILINPKTKNKENIPSQKTENVISDEKNRVVGLKDLNIPSPSSSRKKDNVPSFGNIVGFKDLNKNKSPVKTFSGTGKLLSQSGTSSQTKDNDYSPVRNHWLNKFAISNAVGNTDNSVAKRKSDGEQSPNKKQKIEPIVDLTSKNTDTICPICNKSVAESEINSHLDTCLNADVSIKSEFSDDLENSFNMVECPVCHKKIPEENLNNHLDVCLSRDVDKGESSSSSHSNKEESVPKSDDNFVLCDICKKLVESDDYTLHADECLNKFFDESEQKHEIKSNYMEDSIHCLVCNKTILKANLNDHLEDCMVSVFDNDMKEEETDDNDEIEDDNEENKNNSSTLSKIDGKKYNCPVCMSEINENDMNSHLDSCLQNAQDNGDLFDE